MKLLCNCQQAPVTHTQRERERRGTQSTHDTELIKLPNSDDSEVCVCVYVDAMWALSSSAGTNNNNNKTAVEVEFAQLREAVSVS